MDYHQWPLAHVISNNRWPSLFNTWNSSYPAPAPVSSSSYEHEESQQIQIRWVAQLSWITKTGYLQLVIIAISVLFVARHFYQRTSYSKISDPEGKTSKISLHFEVCSQILRAVSLALMIVASVQGEKKWANVAVLSYAFLLGLFRLTNDLEWRHVVLHQVNLSLFGLLVVVIAAELLPAIDAQYDFKQSAMMTWSIVSLSAAVILSFVTKREWIPPSLDLIPENWPTRQPSPEETCSWLGYYVTYDWLTPLMWKGSRRQVIEDDLPNLPWYDEPLFLLSSVQEARKKGKSTFWTLLRFFRNEITAMYLWIIFSGLVGLVTPYALYNVLHYLADPSQAIIRPWFWLLLMFVGPLLRSISWHRYLFMSTRLYVRVKAALTQELYYKAMSSMELDDEVFAEVAGNHKDAKKQQNTTSAGRLANLMSADIDAISSANNVLMVFGIPISNVVALIGLYKLLAWPALVGISVMILYSPVAMFLAQHMAGIQRDMRKIQDSRISIVSEYLASIRAIKYFAWENAILHKVDNIRRDEQRKIWNLNMLYVIFGVFSSAVPIISMLLIFTLHVVARKLPLTADIAFTAIALVQIIQEGVSIVAQMSKSLTAAGVSMQRIDRFFSRATPRQHHPIGPLKIVEGSFRRHERATFSLKDISINFVEGGLNVINGPSGSGKSTLLMAILGETLVEGGIVTCPQDIAFASQSAWLQNETIRENIIFNSSFEQTRYDRIIKACGLIVDFNEFSERDGTEVGEDGTSLSGGQKSRVALARALYSKAPVLLLDDIFSALDAKTAASVWEDCFCGDMLKDRTIVLVTQLPWIGQQADMIITLENGTVKNTQQNIGVVRTSISLDKAIVDDSNVDTSVETSAASTAMNGTLAPPTVIKTAEEKRRDEVTQEALKTGPTARLQLFAYMRYFGNPLFVIIAIVMSLLLCAVTFGTGLWVAIWVDASQRGAVNIAFYLGIYAAWSFSEVIFEVLAELSYENGGWYAARSLHRNFMKAVLGVSLSWYKNTPVGRAINRFSRDMNSIDTMLASVIRFVIEAFIKMAFQLAAVSSILPVFMIPAAISCSFGILVGEIYTRTAVAVKRLVSSSQSPLFSQFADSLAGIVVIRARANMPTTFGDQLARKVRIFERAQTTQFNCNRWVSMRVDLVTTCVTVAASAIAISKSGTVAAGLVGFSLTNATSLSNIMMMLVRVMNMMEVELQSFHRIQEYASVEPEEKPSEYKEPGAYSDDPDSIIPLTWPRTGEVEFKNVTIKYDDDGPEILNNINLKFAAGERVAVVGRTGSGKSTLILSLLRFTQIVSGQILFDGVDITSFPRRRLREALTIIPQEATLFSGDVDSNLDPTGLIPKATIEKALQLCNGIASFEYRPDGDSTPRSSETHGQGISLSTAVKAKGDNFSHGQRQVLSLCRALVRKSKLMLLDEATASMDYKTDQGIQEVLRMELNEHGRDRTLVTIAHRLQTIIDYDRVVVLSAGRVLEAGSPKELYEARGEFYDMMRHSGEFEDLEKAILSLKGSDIDSR